MPMFKFIKSDENQVNSELILSNQISKLLRNIVLLLVVAVVANFFINIIGNPLQLTNYFIIFELLLLLVTYHKLIAGEFRVGLLIMCWGLWSLTGLLGFIALGIRTPILYLFPTLIMAIAWIQGRFASYLMTAGSILILAMLVIGENQGWLHFTEQRTPFKYFYVYTLIALFSTAIAIALDSNFRLAYAKERTLSKELRERIDQLNSAELALNELNESLELKVAERTAELSTVLDHLRKMQDDLIQSEKLASLGSIVAGVSHELNTPLGNAIMVSSSMLDHLNKLDGLIQGGTFKRSELLSWYGGASEMAQLFDRSIHKAATLVASFKQVAVDQTSERRRTFDLHDVVEDILNTLRPGLKNKPWTLENEISQGIECDSFPGPLGQVITNLIQNAAVHAFEDRTDGNIVVTARTHDENIDISVSDNGIGMPTATLVHIFEPFFTTKLGKGGSGLGLAVSYRIATTILAGDLRVISSVGTGSVFTLTMPRRTPGLL